MHSSPLLESLIGLKVSIHFPHPLPRFAKAFSQHALTSFLPSLLVSTHSLLELSQLFIWRRPDLTLSMRAVFYSRFAKHS